MHALADRPAEDCGKIAARLVNINSDRGHDHLLFIPSADRVPYRAARRQCKKHPLQDAGGTADAFGVLAVAPEPVAG
jgi:hypothetical protein